MLQKELIRARDSGSARLLIALHGLGDSMDGYRWLPEMLRFPWLNYLLVNAPDAYYGGFSWYDFAADAGPGIERSRRLLFMLLDEQREAGFPAEETVIFGFSQGCLMAIEVGLQYPHRFAGIIGISGYTHAPEVALTQLSPCARQQRFLLTHGTHDPLIPFEMVRKQVAFLQSSALNIEWHEFAKEHTIAGEQELAVIRQFIERQFRLEPGARDDHANAEQKG